MSGMYGGDPQNLERVLAQLKALEEVKDELDAKERALGESERGTTTAIIDNTAALQRAIDATRALATETGTLTAGLERETEALRANNQVWEQQVALMNAAASAARRIPAGERAPAAGTRRTRVAAETVAAVEASEPTPIIEERRPPRREESIAGQYGTYLSAERNAAMQSLGAQLAQMQEAERRMASPPRMLEQWAGGWRPTSPEFQAGAINAARAQEAERRVATPPPRMLNPAGAGVPTGDEFNSNTRAAAEEEAAALRQLTAAREQEARAAQAEAEQDARVSENQARAAAMARELAEAQARVELTTNQEAAAFAGLDSRLSRNGALTTEFIQALARGNVTMQEFGSQMTSTIGKFGGWAVAGAAVYGVADGLKQISDGAAATQEGIQNLSRFIPGVTSGPGRLQAEGTFRDISQQMNVPIAEVTSAMTVMARVFHDVADAGQATRAVLLASRLDNITQSQSEQDFIGISTSLNFTKGSQLVGVVDSLNALQNQYGARVSQTLPALTRAAPAAVAGGLSGEAGDRAYRELTGQRVSTAGTGGTAILESLIGTAVRAGVPGAQAGTAILRSIGTFAYRPDSEATFRRYGIQAQEGNYGGLIAQIVQRIDNPKPGQGTLTNQDLQQLAQALGGPLLGSRTLLPLLERSELLPAMARSAERPPSATAELDKVLGGVGEQAKRLGIELQNIGSELESSGLLTPVELLLTALGDLGHVVEVAISPFETIGSVVSALPGPLKDVIGIAAAARAVRFASSTNFGFATQTAISRLPGLSGLRNEQREAVVGTRARLEESILPIEERDLEMARRRSFLAGREFTSAKKNADAAVSSADLNPEDEEAQKAAAEATNSALAAGERQARLVAEANAAQERYLTVTDQLAVLKSDELTYEERYAYLQQENLVLMEAIGQSLRDEVAARSTAAVAAVKSLRGGEDTLLSSPQAGGDAVAASGAQVAQQRAQQTFEEANSTEQALVIGATAGAGNPSVFDEAAQSGTLAEDTAAESSAASPLIMAGRRAVSTVGATAGGLIDGGLSSALGRGALPLAIGGGFISGAVGNAISSVGIGAFLSGQFGESIGGSFGGALDRGASALNLGEEGEGFGLAERFGEVGSSPLLGAGAALALGGASRGGVGGVLEGAAGGALAGSAFGPIGTGVGAAVGAGVSLLGDLFGAGKGSSGETPLDKKLQEQISNANPSLASQVPFSTSFGEELNTAFNNTNQTQADAAQTQVEKSVRSLAQVLKDAGYGTQTTYTDRGLLASAIGGAATSVGFSKDPGDVGQIIDSAQEAIQTRSSNYLQYALAQSPTVSGDNVAYTRATNQLYGAESTERAAVNRQRIGAQITEDESVIKQAEERVKNTAGGFPLVHQAAETGLASAKQQLDQDKQRLQQANDQLEGLKQQDLPAIQADAAAVLQQNETYISDAAALAESTTANKVFQGGVALSAAKETLSKVNSRPGLSPTARKTDREQAQAAINTQLQQNAETAAQELQARLSVSAASVPDYEPVTQAEVALKNATTYYDKLRDFAKKGLIDPAEVNQALAAQKQAIIALNDANYQYQSQIATDTEQLTQARNPAYAYGQAQAQVTLGRRQLQLARNPDERLQARAQIQQGEDAAKEALQSTAQTTYQIAETNETGDPVASATTAVAAANRALAMALGPDQVLQAQLQLAQANQQLHEANQQYITAIGSLRASETNQTLVQDADNLAAARKALAQAVKGGYGKQTVISDQTAVNEAILQQTNDYVSQRVATIQFQQGTLQVSAQGALKQLEGLEKLKNLSVSERQQLAEAAYAIETNQDNTSLFDLAPAGGNVTTPTIYDVRNNAARERARLEDRRSRDVGGSTDSAGTASIGGATVDTTGGALNTHDVTTHAKLDALISAVLSSSGGTTLVSNSTHSSDRLDRVSRRVTAHSRSAGLIGV